MIELRVLGPISLKRSDGSEVTQLLSQPKRLALTAYLAAPPPYGGRCYHRKDMLVAMFWPELDQQRARAALRNALYFLRSCLGANVLRTRGDEVVGLDSDELWCDLDSFDVAVRIRDQATALQLYRGDVLEGVFVAGAQPFEEWLDAQRVRRRAEAQQAATQAARRHAAAGRLDEALQWGRRAVGLAPLNEDAVRTVVALRYLAGDRAGAMEEFNRFESLLRDEHDVPPAPETQRLIDAVRAPETDAEAIELAVAQLPLVRLPLDQLPLRGPGKTSAREVEVLYDAKVLEAFTLKRLGMARRRGGRVGLICVQFPLSPGAAAGVQAGAAPNGTMLNLARIVAEGVRDADLVAFVEPDTLVVLPTEDAATDVNALVGRLKEHVERTWPREGVAHAIAAPEIATCWLDPATDLPAAALLANAIASTPARRAATEV